MTTDSETFATSFSDSDLAARELFGPVGRVTLDRGQGTQTPNRALVGHKRERCAKRHRERQRRDNPYDTSTTEASNPRLPTTDTPLTVTFVDKDQVKALGAQWHADQKRWVVPVRSEDALLIEAGRAK